MSWREERGRPGPPEGEVHVWRAGLGGDGRAAARRWLRAVLDRYLDDCGDRELVTDPRGKPRLVGEPLHFNITHSAATMLVAVSDREVGVDLERIKHGRDIMRLSRRALHPEDAARVREAPPRERPAIFHSAWVRREALAKCFGTGLAGPLPDREAAVLELDCGAGWAAAVAVEGDAVPVRCFQLRP